MPLPLGAAVAVEAAALRQGPVDLGVRVTWHGPWHDKGHGGNLDLEGACLCRVVRTDLEEIVAGHRAFPPARRGNCTSPRKEGRSVERTN